ncbi:unnamed protein product [Clonostachys solani]|uniref:Uncharacterized protein n=1 Tax=Clonostachys solani TaxID=160281 RepID=A0A9N9ZGQ4_9HYPO|nr:unnamed protein product [Clonostachys solani]
MSENCPADQDVLELTDAMAKLSCKDDNTLSKKPSCKDGLPQHQKKSKEQGLVSANGPVDQDALELTDAVAELSCDGDNNLPEEWRNVPGFPGLAVERYFDSLPQHQKKWKEQGLSTFEVITDASGQRMMKPRWCPNPQLSAFKELKHEVGMEWVTLSRNVVAGQVETSLPFRHENAYYRQDPTTHEYKLTTDEWITVPEEEVPKLEEQGWKVYCPPFPALDPETNRDERVLPGRPADVISTDNPVADGNYYLRDGFEMMKRMSDNKWKPGDLLDEDGSDPKVKDGLASYASRSDWDQITDLRSATPTSHVFHHDRPDDVCVGWGGYDDFNHWQSCGRRVTKDMVGVQNPKAAEDPEAEERIEERKWEDDSTRPTRFVDEAGKLFCTVPAYVTQPLQRRGRQTTKKAKPKSLYSRLHPPPKTDKTDKTAKEPKEPKEPTLAWPGTGGSKW